MLIPDTTDLVERRTIESLVGTYDLARLEIEQAYSLLEQAQQRLNAAFLSNSYHFNVNPRDVDGTGAKATAEVMVKVRRDAWACLFDRMQLRKVLSVKRIDELSRRIHDGYRTLPEITEANVVALLEQSMANAESYLQEAVLEVFEFLRPPRSRYKTNTEFEIGKRAILANRVEMAYKAGHFRVKYRYDAELTALDRVFLLLDGKPGEVKTHHGPLYDAICMAEGGVGETDYFRFKCCKNQSLHLEFRRLDLVAKLNAVAGGARLKP